jgi:uncharacterized protein (TIGR02246 family)
MDAYLSVTERPTTMKKLTLLLLLSLLPTTFLYAQDQADRNRQEIYSLIDQYAQAREESNTALLESILTSDIDQLVSSGEWRRGMEGAMQGMMRSSSRNPGERTLTVDQLRFINPETAIVDARYEIKNPDGSARKMWSTFVVVYDGNRWKITAIRNMLPTSNS